MVCFEPLEDRKLFATYYVSPFGSDDNPGTRRHPWKTVEKVSQTSFQGGDRILFQADQSFNGTLYLGPDDKGSRAAPIAISSYGGEGRARINGVQGNGLFAYNTGGLEISKLNFAGPLSWGKGNGIMLFNDLPGDVKLDYIRIDQVACIRHYNGIEIGGNNGASGYRDLWITNTDVYNNRHAGLITYAAERNVHEKILVQRVNAFNNTGLPFEAGTRPPKVTGHGILLSGVNGATVQYSTAFNNGTVGDGGAGIWTYNSNKVLFQFNESYGNRTNGERDGDGFDFDQNVSNSVMQYNYSHDNDGAGFLLSSHEDTPYHTNTIIRYNVSQNDNRKMEYGSLHVFGRITNSEWYNNTVYLTPNDRSKEPFGIQVRNGGIEGQDVKNVHFRNNIITVSGEVKAVKVTSGQLDGATGLRFEGNNYYSLDNHLKFQWGDKDGETNYYTLNSWRNATGQERLDGVAVGFNVNPRHVLPAGALTVGNPDLLGTVTAYELRNDSPLINRGLNLAARFNLDIGGRDFLGNPVTPGTADLGAYEFVR
jgi:hypothetical protein